MIRTDDFRSAMSRVSAAVNVITTDGPDGRYGMTASALCSVTDDPPTLLLCVNRASQANARFKANGVICVNVLSADQEAVSNAFSDRALSIDERFEASGNWQRIANGGWALDGALATLGCRIADLSEVGSHSVFFARVEELLIGSGDAGLVYFDRCYHRLTVSGKAG